MLRNHIYAFLGLCIALTACDKEETKKVINVGFEELNIPELGYWNGSDMSGGFTSGDLIFENSFTDWGGGMVYWSGFGYSSLGDVTTQGYENQYSSYAGSGVDNSENFLVGSIDFYSETLPTISYIDTISGFEPFIIWVTNTTYAALSMEYGDFASKKFGGESGNDPDWFKLMIIGIGLDNQPKDTVEFMLADYTFQDHSDDYIIQQWRPVDVGKLGYVKSLKFSLSSSDVGDYGMNTPAYFCLDQISYLIDNK
jgi:hypothetical protein